MLDQESSIANRQDAGSRIQDRRFRIRDEGLGIRMFVLGIDAGGTKTVCQLANARAEVLSEARRGGANLQAVGELEVEKVLHEVMEEAIGDHDIVPSAICLGIAGVDRPEDARVVRAIMKRIGYKAKCLV